MLRQIGKNQTGEGFTSKQCVPDVLLLYITVQMPCDMKLNSGLDLTPLPNTPHLDPLPSSDEGRGNPAVSVQRAPVSVGERDAPFPLPFRRGEDQGEGLLCKTFASLIQSHSDHMIALKKLLNI